MGFWRERLELVPETQQGIKDLLSGFHLVGAGWKMASSRAPGGSTEGRTTREPEWASSADVMEGNGRTLEEGCEGKGTGPRIEAGVERSLRVGGGGGGSL